MFRAGVKRVIGKSTVLTTTQKRFQSSGNRKFFEQLGDRPKYFENASNQTKGKTLPFIALIFAVPMVLIPLYTDWWIQTDRQNGDPLLKEFEEHRKERNARLATKHQHVVTSPYIDGVDEEQKVTSPLATDNKEHSNVEHYKYVLIGGGTASYCAYKAIRENDPDGRILILTDENYAPYQRPPLSKELWQSSDQDAEALQFIAWNGKKTHVEYESVSDYVKSNVTLKTASKVVDLDVANQRVKLANGQVYQYDKCLLGTGGTPREIPGSESLPDGKISTFRKIDDFKKVHEISKQGANIVVVGGSFLGTELAYALGSHKNQQRAHKVKDVGSVTQIYLEPEVLARNLPRYLSEAIRNSLQSVGVNLKPNRNVMRVSVAKRPVQDSTNSKDRVEKVIVALDNGEELEADFVITATGIFPNTELAENAGLEVDPINGGIVTNSELEARQNVFVAGDVLSYYDVVLGRRRIEHYEHATATGRHAGLNMSSNNMKPFRHVSMFWSDVGKSVSFQAVGEIKSELDTYGVWDGVAVSQNGTSWSQAPAPIRNESFKKGIVYYMKDKRVVGILMWNVNGPNVMREARRIILQKKKYMDTTELQDLINLREKN